MEDSRIEAMYRSQLMGELKSLLLAVDGSPFSEGAIKEALLFSKSCGIRLTLLYIQGLIDSYESGGLTFVERRDTRIDDYFDKIREDAAEENVELDIIIRRTDDPYKGIIDEAVDRQSDVIIMGRRGMTGLKRMLMGSVTAKVIAYAPCKVLVVPREASIKGEHIMLATDGSRYSDAAQEEAISMAKRCPQVKTFTALSVASSDNKLDDTRRILDGVTSTANRVGVNVETVTAVGSPYESIVETARTRNTNIIVMGTHGRTGIDRLLMGSVAERVVALSPCSVLVVKGV
ncbi:MAG: universal stress protein [Magnetococcales bacterium]|uniref:Universal stress protein n=1 Tax=Candidatus Magnetobacterium casense TaxID=1455061 RepID=A0ABS6RW83_9BACT|nr:universal stress protein [Candidatus Magnetobacterium casensis]MBF0608033.1 universal stress protein [Nitrospirota bacterium]MBV6340890.1 universal stress protein [Candidatus Magnetobacterium casensis]